MDVHIPRAITEGLRLRGIEVLTSQEDGTEEFSDSDLLNRATALGRVLVSQDHDLLREAARRQQRGEAFAGVIYAPQLKVTIGQFLSDLELIAHVAELEDFTNRVEYLPLRGRIST